MIDDWNREVGRIPDGGTSTVFILGVGERGGLGVELRCRETGRVGGIMGG